MINTEITAGDTLKWSEVFPAYPAGEGYAVKYCLNGPGDPKTFISTPDGDLHTFNISAATTAVWEPGDYTFAAFAVKDDERYFLASGDLTVKPDPLNLAAGADNRSYTKKLLDMIRTVILGQADSAVLEREVDGTKLKYWSTDRLLSLEEKLQARLNRENGFIDLPPTLNLTFRGGI